MQINTLPILLKNPKILLIGGGNVALQKAKVLFENNIDFHIISLQIKPQLYQLTKHIKKKKFKKKYLKNFFIIIDATANKKVKKKLLKYKKKHNILINFVDQPKICDFYFMALTKNRPLQIAVSSNGASPTVAKFFRDECEKMIPNNIDEYLQKKQKEREKGVIDKEQTKIELEKYMKH